MSAAATRQEADVTVHKGDIESLRCIRTILNDLRTLTQHIGNTSSGYRMRDKRRRPRRRAK